MAYEFACKDDVKIPISWKVTGYAVPHWLTEFFHFHGRLIISSTEATSLARMSAFNRTTVREFIYKLQCVKERYFFTPEEIFNLKEAVLLKLLLFRKF